MHVHKLSVSQKCPHMVNAPSLPQMEPLIKESTSRLAEKISAFAERGETVQKPFSKLRDSTNECFHV